MGVRNIYLDDLPKTQNKEGFSLTSGMGATTNQHYFVLRRHFVRFSLCSYVLLQP